MNIDLHSIVLPKILALPTSQPNEQHWKSPSSNRYIFYQIKTINCTKLAARKFKEPNMDPEFYKHLFVKKATHFNPKFKYKRDEQNN